MNRIPKRFLQILLVAAASLPLALYAALGQFTRYMWDDYCYAGFVSQWGYWEAFQYMRNAWHGGYSYLFVFDILSPVGVYAGGAIALATIAIWLAGLAWLLGCLCRMFAIDARNELAILCAALLMLGSIIYAIPSLEATLWYASIIRYMLPLALLTLCLALTLDTCLRSRSRVRDRLAAAIVTVLCFISAGMAEMSLVFQIAVMVFSAPLLYFVKQRGNRRLYIKMWLAGFASSIAGFAFVVSAPGMIRRVSMALTDSQGIDPLSLLNAALTKTNYYLLNADFIAAFALSLAIGALLSLRGRRGDESRGPQRDLVTRKALLALLGVQLAVVPIVWDHTSDFAIVLGRFSVGYTVAIAINALQIAGYCVLLWRKRFINHMLRRWGWSMSHIWTVALVIAMSLLLLSLARPIHWRALLCLTASQLSILLTMLWQTGALDSAAKPLKRLLRATIAVALLVYLVVVAVIVTELALKEIVLDRTMGFVPALLALTGFFFGSAVGCAISWTSPSRAAPFRAMKAIIVLVIVALAWQISREQAAQIPRFQQFAREWDARHQKILDGKQRGLAVVEVAPLSIDLEKEISRKAIYENGCSEIYYELDDIVLAAD